MDFWINESSNKSRFTYYPVTQLPPLHHSNTPLKIHIISYTTVTLPATAPQSQATFQPAIGHLVRYYQYPA